MRTWLKWGFIFWIVLFIGFYIFFGVTGYRAIVTPGYGHFTCSYVVQGDSCTFREYVFSLIHLITFGVLSFSGFIAGAILGRRKSKKQIEQPIVQSTRITH